MSQALTLARPYARAAFAAARDEGRVDAWSQALGFAAQVAGDARVSDLLINPELARERMVSEQNAAMFRREVLALFDDDPQARDILEGTMEDMTAEELRELTSLSQTAYDSKRFGIKMGDEVPMTVTNRAYTSPIWYSPAK